MSHLTGRQRTQYMRRLFARIAPRYGLLNRLMTFGQDMRWRREVIRRAQLRPGARLLDLGSGTGDLALEALHQMPLARIVAADFTPEMVSIGRARPGGKAFPWIIADALHLPFVNRSFDAVVSGFLLRNVADLDQALHEQHRVLRTGGGIVCLDTTPPRPGPFRFLMEFHLHHIIPLLGRLVAGDAEAYNYLPESTEGFLPAESLAGRMEAIGFREVGFARRMVGSVAIHWGSRATGDRGT
jgi:demethylmenaquinone methyltransferase/2-methoxy-6-polyprenyl-1,4-benzoquinol methylase